MVHGVKTRTLPYGAWLEQYRDPSLWYMVKTIQGLFLMVHGQNNTRTLLMVHGQNNTRTLLMVHSENNTRIQYLGAWLEQYWDRSVWCTVRTIQGPFLMVHGQNNTGTQYLGAR